MRRLLETTFLLTIPLIPLDGTAGQQVAAAEARPAEVGTPPAAPALALRLERRVGPIRIDGVPDEAAWSLAQRAGGFVQQEPAEGAPASQPTDVFVLADDRSIYVAARLADAAAEGVTARLARRDADVVSDWFYVYIDAYRDRRTALGFGVNAAGVQRDVRISDDDRTDASWDAVWESAVARDGDGWTVELRIPLSQLRFTPGATEAWGLQLERRIARVNERALWAPVPRGADGFVSRFGLLRGVQSLRGGRRIEVTPYTAARLTGEPVPEGDPFRAALEPDAAAGLDLRAGIGAGFTLSATLNPDFGQVEADPALVNLTAFEIYQQERRPFFVEGSEVFQMATPAWPPVFYSRRIGRAPQARAPGDARFADAPAATTILGAAKITGQAGPWTLGLMEAVTAEESARYETGAGERGSAVVEPLTSYTAARVSRRFRDGRSGIGVIGTATRRRLDEHRLRFLHSAAYAGGVDAWHRFAGDALELRVGLLASHVRGDSTAILRTQRAPGHYFQRPDAEHLELDPARTSLSGYSLNARLQNTGGRWRVGAFGEATTPGYEVADLGFNPSLDRARAAGWVRYHDYSPGRLLRSWWAGSVASYETTFGGERLDLTQDLGIGAQLLNYWSGRVWVMRHLPAWDPHELRGGPALRRPGRWMGDFDVASDTRRPVRGSARAFWEAEDETDSYRLSVSSSLSVRPSGQLDVRVGPSWYRARDAWHYLGTQTLGDESLTLLARADRTTLALAARADYTLSPDLSLQLYARPYLAAGRYGRLMEVADPAAPRFSERFRAYPEERVETVTGEDGRRVFHVDRDGDGIADFDRAAPDFNVRSLQVNAVMRWQYRPGSTLFVVLSHDRHGASRHAADLRRDLDALAGLRGRNIVMVKLSHWLGL